MVVVLYYYRIALFRLRSLAVLMYSAIPWSLIQPCLINNAAHGLPTQPSAPLIRVLILSPVGGWSARFFAAKSVRADVWALHALKLLVENIVTVVRDPSNEEAQKQMCLAATYAG